MVYDEIMDKVKMNINEWFLTSIYAIFYLLHTDELNS